MKIKDLVDLKKRDARGNERALGYNEALKDIEEVEKRHLEYAQLTDKERIARLDKKLGVGVGAKKQRERISTGRA